jgi:hypothetical protein
VWWPAQRVRVRVRVRVTDSDLSRFAIISA